MLETRAPLGALNEAVQDCADRAADLHGAGVGVHDQHYGRGHRAVLVRRATREPGCWRRRVYTVAVAAGYEGAASCARPSRSELMWHVVQLSDLCE
jgi:hypothetical protein